MSYPYLVNSAWYVVENLIQDWQKQPYRWDKEIDIHTELAGRLSNLCELVGRGVVEGTYKDVIPGFEPQLWSRVACEPYVSYMYENKLCRCHPDIVIWDDLANPESPPEEANWPILWACEIKYTNKEPGDWDLEKLQYLVRQNHIKHGCWLRFHKSRATSGNGIK